MAGDALDAVLIGTTIGMVNIAPWTLAIDSPILQFLLTLRPGTRMVYVGDRNFFTLIDVPVGDERLSPRFVPTEIICIGNT